MILWQRPIIILLMNRNRPYINRFVKQKEIEIAELYHDINMKDIKDIKPITAKLMQHSETFTINHSKRDMIKEARENEIERENKMLLNKIESVLGRKALYSVSKTKSTHSKASKSLNEIFRKKKMETIEQENKQLLTRLNSKRATLDTTKMKKDWEHNKNTIKRLTNYEFNMVDFKGKQKIIKTKEKITSENFDNIKVSKFKVIDGVKMLIKVQVIDSILTIIGDLCNHKDLKLIQVPKEQALNIIENSCAGRLDKLIESLSYDKAAQTLFLSFESSSLKSDPNPQRAKIKIKQRSMKKMAAKSCHRNKSVLDDLLSGEEQKEKLYNQAITHRDKIQHPGQADIKSHSQIATVQTKPVKVQAEKVQDQENYEQQHFEEGENQKIEEKKHDKEVKLQEEIVQSNKSEVQNYEQDFEQNEGNGQNKVKQ